jgi:hypothetical protein
LLRLLLKFNETNIIYGNKSYCLCVFCIMFFVSLCTILLLLIIFTHMHRHQINVFYFFYLSLFSFVCYFSFWKSIHLCSWWVIYFEHRCTTSLYILDLGNYCFNVCDDNLLLLNLKLLIFRFVGKCVIAYPPSIVVYKACTHNEIWTL